MVHGSLCRRRLRARVRHTIKVQEADLETMSKARRRAIVAVGHPAGTKVRRPAMATRDRLRVMAMTARLRDTAKGNRLPTTIKDLRPTMAKVLATMTNRGRRRAIRRDRPATNRDIMIKLRTVLLVTSVAGLISGCVTPPMGPTVNVMPGPNKSLEAFQQDEAACEDYAGQRTAGGAEAANNQAIGEGVLGTALGAGLGAAIGGGRGAAIGAGSGAVVGTAVGADTSAHAQYTLQQRYNMAYMQCMSTKGDRVPPRRYPPPPPPGYGPPPPGYGPPPPPPGY